MIAAGDQVSGLDGEEISELLEVMINQSGCGFISAVYRSIKGRELVLEFPSTTSSSTLLRHYRMPEYLSNGDRFDGSQISAATRFEARIDLGEGVLVRLRLQPRMFAPWDGAKEGLGQYELVLYESDIAEIPIVEISPGATIVQGGTSAVEKLAADREEKTKKDAGGAGLSDEVRERRQQLRMKLIPGQGCCRST